MDIARWSVQRKTVVLFLCGVVAVIGTVAFNNLGRLEDPEYTIKTAVVTTTFPGASAHEVEKQVTSRVEDAVQAMGEIKRIRSRSTDGVSIVYVDIKDKYTKVDLPQIWDILRQKITDLQPALPPGASSSVNNDFGDVYGQYYALTGDGYTMKELWDYADFLKKQLVLVPRVASVSIIGDQTEAIYVEFSRNKLSSLGLAPESIYAVLNQQNAVSSAGNTILGDQYLRLNPSGAIQTPDDIADLVIGGGGTRLIRLREVASVRRDYLKPQRFSMYFNGRPALGIGISTVAGGNVVAMGFDVKKRLNELSAYTPVGMELEPIYMQSDQVVVAVNGFVLNLLESVVIVVGVLLVFMGIRTGLMIGIVLLLTIAATFVVMEPFNIFLQQVSLAALIIALGSLVDNAIVVSEGMLVGVESGVSAVDAVSRTVEDNKWALLGGTTIAVIAFSPIGLSQDSTGEYTVSLFQVVAISMFLSWILALTVTPVMGCLLLKPPENKKDPYGSFLFRGYRAFLEGCIRWRWVSLTVTAVLTVLSIWAFQFVPQSFFPESSSAYYTVDLWQPQGTSIEAQQKVADELAEYLHGRAEVKDVTSFVGRGGLRFMLTYTPEDPNPAYATLLVQVKNPESTHFMMLETDKYMVRELPNVRGICKLFGKGSGMAPKIEARFYGPDPQILRRLAGQACDVMEADMQTDFVRIDWRQPTAVLRPQIIKDQMRTLGLTLPMINTSLRVATDGYTIGLFRDRDKLLPIIASVPQEERYQMDRVASFPIWAPAANKSVPLGTVVSSVQTTFDDAIVWRRNRSPVLTAQCDVILGANVVKVLSRFKDKIEAIPLPVGYSLEWGGEYELSAWAMEGVMKLFPYAVLIMFIICVFLFNAFKQPFIIFICLPMIMVGVTSGLLVMDAPFSFMALLGLLSLVGMLIKNTVVLLDQVAADFAAGKDHYQTIVDSGVSRLRPVAMSALTTVLGMVPLVWDVLFAPLSVTVMFGLTASSILTLLIVPVLTAVFYHVPSPSRIKA